ncbi:MAG: hypothetical protein CUR32_13385 [Flavobacterium sp.]|nr:MAG: hypothetical protein CUR32_13385 [Flavobacterium sp.] [Flavobacterium sp. FEMGT703F]
MGSLSHDLEHGNGRVGDFWLGEDGKVYYKYQQWGDTTPDSDNYNYGYITTTECCENPDPQLINRLKTQLNNPVD